MRIWQRRTTAWIGVGSAHLRAFSVTRSLNSSSGRRREALRLGSLDLEVQVRHGPCPPRPDRSFRPAKNRPISSQTSVPARQAAPVRADQADQLVALVDAARGSSSRAAPTRLTSSASTSGSSSRRTGFVRDQRLPGLQRQQRLGRPRRAWVQGDDPARRRAVQEEGQVDRQVQALPLLVRQAEVGQESTRRGTRRYLAAAAGR